MADTKDERPDGDEIRRLRNAKALSQGDLADAAVVSVWTVRRMEAGKGVSLRNRNKIAGALGVEPPQIMRRHGSQLPAGDLLSLQALWKLHPLAEVFVAQNNLPQGSMIGDYLQLEAAPGWRGWDKSRVSLLETAGDYVPGDDIISIMDRFRPKPGEPVNKLYGLHSYTLPEVSGDAIRAGREPRLQIRVSHGSWAHSMPLCRAWETINRVKDADCERFREIIERDFLFVRAGRSRLFYNMVVHAVVVTSDRKIVIARRSKATDVYQDLWSASLEEGLLREKDDKSKKGDHGDLFECARRGADEELNATVIPGRTRLLSFGCEFGTCGAAFIFVVHCTESFAGISKKWPHADDKKELAVLDYIEEDEIMKALGAEQWTPNSKRMITSHPEDPNAAAPSAWHPTSKARLLAYLRHLNAEHKPKAESHKGRMQPSSD